jgi:hypothetical protein
MSAGGGDRTAGRTISPLRQAVLDHDHAEGRHGRAAADGCEQCEATCFEQWKYPKDICGMHKCQLRDGHSGRCVCSCGRTHRMAR